MICSELPPGNLPFNLLRTFSSFRPYRGEPSPQASKAPRARNACPPPGTRNRKSGRAAVYKRCPPMRTSEIAESSQGDAFGSPSSLRSGRTTGAETSHQAARRGFPFLLRTLSLMPEFAVRLVQLAPSKGHLSRNGLTSVCHVHLRNGPAKPYPRSFG